MCPPLGKRLREKRACAKEPCRGVGATAACGGITVPSTLRDGGGGGDMFEGDGEGAVWRLLGSGGALYADISTAHCQFRCFSRHAPPLTPAQVAAGERARRPLYPAFYVASLVSTVAEGSCRAARAWELDTMLATGSAVGAPVLQYPVGSTLQSREGVLRVVVAHAALRGAALLRAARRGGWAVSWVGDCGAGAGITARGSTGWSVDLAHEDAAAVPTGGGQPHISARVDLGQAEEVAAGKLAVVASLVAPAGCLGAALGLALNGGGGAAVALRLENEGSKKAGNETKTLRVVLRAPARFEELALLAPAGRAPAQGAIATVAAREAERCGLQVAWVALPASAQGAARRRDSTGLPQGMLHFAGTAPASSGWTRHSAAAPPSWKKSASARGATAAVLQRRVRLPPHAALSALHPAFVAALVHEGGAADRAGAGAPSAALDAVSGADGGAVLCGADSSGFALVLGLGRGSSTATGLGAGWRVHYIAVARRPCAVTAWRPWGACQHACGAGAGAGAHAQGKVGLRSAAATAAHHTNAAQVAGAQPDACFQLRKRGLRTGVQGASSCEVPALRQARACTRVATVAPSRTAPAPAPALGAAAVATTKGPAMEAATLARLRQRLRADLAAKVKANAKAQTQAPQRNEEPLAAASAKRRGALVTALACVGAVYAVLAMRWLCGGGRGGAAPPSAPHAEESWGLADGAARRRALKRGTAVHQQQRGVRYADEGTLELHPMNKYENKLEYDATLQFSC